MKAPTLSDRLMGAGPLLKQETTPTSWPPTGVALGGWVAVGTGVFVGDGEAVEVVVTVGVAAGV
jgi:hypothetical protein